jgi:peptide chain release factor 1
MGQLNELVDAIKIWEEKRTEYDELKAMIKSSSEPEMINMAQEEIQKVISSLQEAETTIAEYFAKPDSADSAAAIMEIRPAAGGLEAGLFAGEMFEAYQRYF